MRPQRSRQLNLESLEPRLLMHAGHGGSSPPPPQQGYGPTGSTVFYGDWDGDRDIDEGAYKQNRNTTIYWLDLDDDGKHEKSERFLVRGRNLELVVGDVTGDGADNIGYFRSDRFKFDTTGDFLLRRNDLTIRYDRAYSHAAVVDVDKDGNVDLAVRTDNGKWRVDLWENNVDQKAFAKSLKAAGVKLYGFQGNPQTAVQKNRFGNAARYLPYVECNDGNGNANTVCQSEGINVFPTWDLGARRLTGVQSLGKLSKLTNIDLNLKPYEAAIDLLLDQLPS